LNPRVTPPPPITDVESVVPVDIEPVEVEPVEVVPVEVEPVAADTVVTSVSAAISVAIMSFIKMKVKCKYY
jgi:hypothetical protein